MVRVRDDASISLPGCIRFELRLSDVASSALMKLSFDYGIRIQARRHFLTEATLSPRYGFAASIVTRHCDSPFRVRDGFDVAGVISCLRQHHGAHDVGGAVRSA